MTYASNGSRIGAYLLDGLILGLVELLAFFVASIIFPLIILLPIVPILYFTCTEGGSMMASPGKSICGLMVVDEHGQPLDFGKALGRNLAKYLSSLLFGIGYIIGLFDAEGKTLHDSICGTRVIEAASYRGPSANAAPVRNAYPTPAPMPRANSPKLVCISGSLAGQAFSIPPQGLIIGKDSAVCNVAVSLPNVSRSHCKLTYNPSSRTFVLQDLGSTNGTFLRNGTRLNRSTPYALNDGDEFYIAGRTLIFRVTF